MNRLRAHRIMAAVSALLGLTTLVLTGLNGSVVHGATAAWNGWGETGLWVILMGFACALGVLVAVRQPTNRISWVFVSGGLLGMLSVAGDHYAGYALVTRPGSVPGGVAARFVSFLAFSAMWFIAGVLLPALFPSGRFLTRRWRWAARLGGAGAGLWSLLIFLPNAFEDDGLLGDVRGVHNPLGVATGADAINAVTGVGILLLFGGTFLAIVSLVVRAVRSQGEERQQIKIVAYTLAVTTVVQLVVANTLDVVSFPGQDAVWNAFSTLSGLAVPGAIALAVLRYRLYDVDRLINRTIVYAILTGLLAGAYAGGVFVLGLATRPFTQGSDLAVAGGTLVIAALFVPLRRVVQRFIDRRFYRTSYNAARTLDAFAARLRDQTDIASLGAEIEEVARRTMRPAHVHLWLR